MIDVSAFKASDSHTFMFVFNSNTPGMPFWVNYFFKLKKAALPSGTFLSWGKCDESFKAF